MNKYLLALVLALASFASAQTTTYTGVIRDLSNNAVTSGQVTFAITPSSDSTISGTARYTPTVIACNINGDGSLSGYVGGVVSGACVIASNTALMPAGTAYRVCVQPQFATPGSCFYDYAVTASKDISTVIPTLTTGPVNYALNGAVMTAAGEQTVIQQQGTTLAVNSLDTTVIDLDLLPGSDLGQRIANAQTFLGLGRGVLTVNTAATLSTAITLAAGNDLRFNAPVTISALVTLGGSNQVSCSGSGALTVTSGNPFTSTANNLSITGCTATGNGTVNELLTTNGSAHTKLTNNVLSEIGIVSAVGGSDLLVSGNTVTWPSLTSSYGALWSGTNDVRVDHNSFLNIANAAEFFNADADPNHSSPATSRAAVLAFAGHYVISNNTCLNAVACYWGSVGHDIVMSGNYASNCGDVCYDLEGSIDALVIGNRGDDSANGMGTTFFFADHVTFLGNEFSSSNGSPLIGVHNSSQAPMTNEYLTIQDNVLSCYNAICQAAGGDAAADVMVVGNRLLNSAINFASFGGNTVIKRNELNFTIAGASAFNAIGTPNMQLGGVLQIEDNTVTGGVGQPSGSACIANTSSDYNSLVTLQISHNRCFGGFAVDLSTTNAGTNAGTGVLTTMTENWWGANNVVHTHTTASVDSYNEISKYTLASGIWGLSKTILAASLTTTYATYDVVTILGMTGAGHCGLSPTNSTADAASPAAYVSAKGTNQVTVVHPMTAGLTYDLICTNY